jgi:hypothetical protein
VCLLLAGPGDVAGAPVLRSAEIRIAVPTPTSCEVTIALTISEAGTIEHRLGLFEGDAVELVETRDADQVAPARQTGRTQVLMLRPRSVGGRYGFRYRATLSGRRAYTCPVWVPAVPADGRSKNVQLRVELPPGTLATGATLPTFEWRGHEGTSTLGHVPAFVRVPYAADGTGGRFTWDVSRAMDGIAVAVFAVATAIWLWRRRR